jgi:predicted lipoprotein
MIRNLLMILGVLPFLAMQCPTEARAQSKFTDEQAAILQAGLTTTADGFVLPGYRAQEQGMAALASALDSYCDSGDAAALQAAQSHFREAFLAWQRVSIVQVGPVMEAEGPKRVQLWPDPKGFTARAVRAAINAEDPSLNAEGGLEGRSIALVNTEALEDLLYDDLHSGTYACDLAISIARFQDDLSKSFVEAWTPGSEFRTAYDTAASGNARYDSVDELIREMIAGGVVYIDALRKKIQRGIGVAQGEARPERTEAQISGLGLASIATSYRALSDFFALPGGLFDVTPELGATMEYAMLSQTAGSIADELDTEPRSLVEIAEEDGEMAQELRALAGLLTYQEDYLRAKLAESIGMTSGFTSADGD